MNLPGRFYPQDVLSCFYLMWFFSWTEEANTKWPDRPVWPFLGNNWTKLTAINDQCDQCDKACHVWWDRFLVKGSDLIRSHTTTSSLRLNSEMTMLRKMNMTKIMMKIVMKFKVWGSWCSCWAVDLDRSYNTNHISLGIPSMMMMMMLMTMMFMMVMMRTMIMIIMMTVVMM